MILSNKANAFGREQAPLLCSSAFHDMSLSQIKIFYFKSSDNSETDE